jgi:N-methylhydantoinase A/oxoprolinase/acetone carboxylase beta subunit
MGGAGPLHGAEVARMLGIPEVLVPRFPGIASAIGLMTTDPRYDTSRTVFGRSDRLDFGVLDAGFTGMQAELTGQLRADGIDPAAASFHRAADLRYLGQGYELRIAAPEGRLTAASVDRLFADFHAAHAAEYGHGFPGEPVEIVNLRLTATAPAAKLRGVPPPRPGSLSVALIGRAPCMFRTPQGLRSLDTPRYERDRLPLEEPIAGPAIILQADSTTIVPPGARVSALWDGNLVIRLQEGS